MVEDWMTMNEKIKTAFYDRLKELPVEWQRRFRVLPDNRSTASATVDVHDQPFTVMPA